MKNHDSYNLYVARARLERAYNEFTIGRPVTDIVVHAERDIFRTLVDSFQAVDRFSDNPSLLPDSPRVPNFAYKNAHVFCVERDGWGLTFHGNVEETYR